MSPAATAAIISVSVTLIFALIVGWAYVTATYIEPLWLSFLALIAPFPVVIFLLLWLVLSSAQSGG